MNTNRPRRCLSIIGVSLLIFAGAACGSDSKTDSTVAVTEVGSASSVVASASSVVTAGGGTEATAGTPTTDDSSLDTVAAATASDDREAIVQYLGNIADAGGFAIDKQCVTDLIAKLSDSDAKMLADSARASGAGNPELSAEGDAIGNQIESCATPPTTG